MQWITATELEQWATHRLSARAEMSGLVGDLIRASVTDLTAYRFPRGDKSQIRGFDGEAHTVTGSLYVPEGQSVWEIGIGEPKEKADDDYDNRTKKEDVSFRAMTTFVFVTPRAWPDGGKWAAERKSRGDWKDVRCLTSIELETWLQERPAVAARFARFELRNHKEGARGIAEFWEEYSTRFSPPLMPEVLLADRANQASEVIKALQAGPALIKLAADSPDEVVAFVVAAILKAEPETRFYLEARTMVVDQLEVARFYAPKTGLIFLPTRGAVQAEGLLQRSGPTLSAKGNDWPDDAHTRLERPTPMGMAKALETMGFDYEAARQHSEDCGRSVTILARQIASGSRQPPPWANAGATLVPLLLAGAWDATLIADKEIVRGLCGGREYIDIERELREYQRLDDPPVDKLANVWAFRSPVDAFVCFGRQIDQQHLDRLAAAVRAVFSTDLQAPDAADPMAAFLTPKLPHSSWLREGLARSALHIATLHKQAEFAVDGVMPQAYANSLLTGLPGFKKELQAITRIGRQLITLAEAAPDPLLAALEALLEGDGSALKPLFDETPGLMSRAGDYTEVLWALELLGWDPRYLNRVALILAKMAAIDPGGKYANRPIESLRALFVSWVPHTNAPLKQRVAVVDEVIRAVPEVGWTLLTKLLPRSHDSSNAAQKPRFRDAGSSNREVLTHGLLRESYASFIQRAIQQAGGNADRWMMLIGAVAAFDPKSRMLALGALDNFLTSASMEDRARVWADLRDEAARHQVFADTDWALRDEGLQELTALVKKHEPGDAILRVSWLFDDWMPDIPGNVKHAEEPIAIARRAAVREVNEQHGQQGILDLLARVKLPQFVVGAFVEVTDNFVTCETLLDAMLDNGEALSYPAAIMSGGLYRKFWDDWSQSLLRRASTGTLPAERLAGLLYVWPDEPRTWEFATQLGVEIETAYWSGKPAFPLSGSESAISTAAIRYLNAGRALSAIDSVYNSAEKVPTPLVLRMLDEAADELSRGSGGGIGNSFAYHICRIFDDLAGREDLSDDDLAKREFTFLSALEHRKKPMRLHQMLARSPSLYMSVITAIFKPRHCEAEESTPQDRARAHASYDLLHDFATLPGRDGDTIDFEALQTWCVAVRKAAAEVDRAEITDQYIGQLLAHSPTDPEDRGWPHQTVRKIIERLASDEIERGFRIGRFNQRGAHWKALYEGGKQERELATEFRDWADKAVNWPRTAASLLQMAEDYEQQAQRADAEAEQEKRRL